MSNYLYTLTFDRFSEENMVNVENPPDIDEKKQVKVDVMRSLHHFQFQKEYKRKKRRRKV